MPPPLMWVCALRVSFSGIIVALIVTLQLLAGSAAAQTRGAPPVFESTLGAAQRAGLEFRHGGELDGGTLAVIGSHSLGVGARRRLTLSAATGVWNPPIGEARFTGAVGAQWRLCGACRQGQVSNLTIRGLTGVGVVIDAGRARWSVPVGIGAAYRLPIPAIHIEPWLIPYATWQQRSPRGDPRAALPTGSSTVEAAVAAGVTLGASKRGGFRVAATCCIGGVAASYSVSAWF